MRDGLLLEFFGICSGIRSRGGVSEEVNHRPEHVAASDCSLGCHRGRLKGGVSRRELGNEPQCQRRPAVADSRATHAGSSSAERTTDPYINLELNAKF